MFSPEAVAYRLLPYTIQKEQMSFLVALSEEQQSFVFQNFLQPSPCSMLTWILSNEPIPTVVGWDCHTGIQSPYDPVWSSRWKGPPWRLGTVWGQTVHGQEGGGGVGAGWSPSKAHCRTVCATVVLLESNVSPLRADTTLIIGNLVLHRVHSLKSVKLKVARILSHGNY